MKSSNPLAKPFKKLYITSTETIGETFVSSGCWGEDSNHELAGAAHFHVASPALNFKDRKMEKGDE